MLSASALRQAVRQGTRYPRVLITQCGRPDGYSDKRNFALVDALEQGLGALNMPVIYDADIGHIPPQIQIVNGAIGRVEFADGKATIKQTAIDELFPETGGQVQ